LLQDLVEELFEKLAFLEEDKKLQDLFLPELDNIYQGIFKDAVETHGKKLSSDMDSLLHVSQFVKQAVNIKISLLIEFRPRGSVDKWV
jgi:hypothetical protein